MSTLLEYLWRHVARSAACRGQDVKLLLVHDSGKAKVGDEKIGIVLGGAKQQVLGLEIAVNDAVIMQVCHGGQGGPDEVCSIRLVVGSLAADAVEQLTTQGQVSHQIQIVHRLKIVDQRQDVLVAHRHALEHGNLVAHHVFTTGHEALIDDLCGIVATRVDVHAFLDHRVGACAQCLARLISARLHLHVAGHDWKLLFLLLFFLH